MRAVIYARVSTTDQKTEPQLVALREYSERRRFELVAEYVDHGVSGAKASRPALERLLGDAHGRNFEAVLVTKLDRLGRSLSHLIRVVETLGALGVDLVSLGDPGLDTTGPSGRLMFHVIGAVAEFERDLIRERVEAGVKAAKRRGVQFGRPRALDDQQRARVQRLRRSGHSIRAIAQTLRASRSVVSRELSRNLSSRNAKASRPSS